MKAGLFLAMMMTATAVSAAPPPAAAPGQALPRIPGVSDAANAVFAKARPALAQQLTPLVQQQNAVGTQLNAVVSAPTLDVAKFGALLQQRRQLLGQITARQDDWLLGVLNQMPAADRSTFLKAISTRSGPPGAAH